MSHAATSTILVQQKPGQVAEQALNGVRAVRILSGGGFGARIATTQAPSESNRADMLVQTGMVLPVETGSVWFDFIDQDTGNAAEYPPIVLELYHGNLAPFGASPTEGRRAATYWFDPLSNFSVATGATPTQIASSRMIDSTIWKQKGCTYPTFNRWTGVIRSSDFFTVRHVVAINGVDIIVGIAAAAADLATAGAYFCNLDDGWYRPTGNTLLAAVYPVTQTVSEIQGRPGRLVQGQVNRLLVSQTTGVALLMNGRLGATNAE